jgi:hypothetical protein
MLVVSITKANWLLHLKETIVISCENHMKHEVQTVGYVELLMLKQVAHRLVSFISKF